jgi:D-serine deaminase-like pyridoxal phosphate-dependent protein
MHAASPDGWWRIANADEIPSPALLIYPDRAEENVRRMVQVAGDAARLTPHVKTHKLGALIETHLRHGIGRFKCATIAEAEMTAEAGARDVLLAYQPVGPSVARLIALTREYPATRFSVIADDQGAIAAIGRAAAAANTQIPVLLDLDVGMHRTGVAPGADARALYHVIAGTRGVVAGGLHAYDGHVRDRDLTARAAKSDAGFAGVASLKRELEADGLDVPRLIAGGSPTFPVHARRADVELSPGTTVLWDASYGTDLPDLPFLPSALVLTRVVSKPGGQRVCLDLGHKAIASENPHPRVMLINPLAGGTPATGAIGESSRALGLPLLEATFVGHSEEHLVLETPDASRLRVGDALYGMPWHVCPTVALHSEAVIVGDGRAVDRWPIRARARRLTV